MTIAHNQQLQTYRKFGGVLPDINFPDLYDASDEIGEAALDRALPWDTIETTSFYRPFANLKPALPALTSRHEERLQNDPDFNYIEAQIARALENQEDETLSLNIEILLAEREENDAWRLQLENSRRLAKGEEPYESIEAMENSGDEEEDTIAVNKPGLDEEELIDGDEEEDPYLRESANVLLDLIELQADSAFSMAQKSN